MARRRAIEPSGLPLRASEGPLAIEESTTSVALKSSRIDADSVDEPTGSAERRTDLAPIPPSSRKQDGRAATRTGLLCPRAPLPSYRLIRLEGRCHFRQKD